MLKWKSLNKGKPEAQLKDHLDNLKKSTVEWSAFLISRLQDIPGNHIAIGKDFLERGMAVDAAHRFKAVLWFKPKHEEAQALLTQAYARANQMDKAKLAVLELKKTHPKSSYIAQVEQVMREVANPPKPVEQPVDVEP